ncbi:LysR family transcriptional regulator [Kiloniella laminariae]|uniref:LysR family transcriptional regulator n=1 Tax=Kiloniella laminariae TaxID=454162 RepID=UPI00035FC449|nr:LysR family transcriptional regulator [Kiloniella laminariae]
MRRYSDKFHLMSVFVRVVESGAFNKAADSLGLKASSVSKAISQLEKDLGVSLLYRTTRQLSLTDAGKFYYQDCNDILTRVTSLEGTISVMQQEPVGNLRITAPTAFGQYYLGPQLPLFLARYPEVSVELDLTEELRDITRDGYDLAIRSSDGLPDSSLYALKLVSQQRYLVASPAYLERKGSPTSPRDLQQHDTLIYSAMKQPNQWSFTRASLSYRIRLSPRLETNSYYILRDAARAGQGIANLNDYMVAEDIKNGALVPLLPQYPQIARDRYAVYHQKRELVPKLHAFLSFLNETLEEIRF